MMAKKGRKPKKGKDQFTPRQRATESADMKPNSDYSKDPKDKKDLEKGPNSIDWYVLSPEILQAVGSLPTGYPLGLPIGAGGASYGQSQISNTTVPGIMALRFTPNVGYALTPTSAINVSLRQIYSDVRHKNSGRKNYDAPDLMMYLLGMDAPYTFHQFMVRVYGTLLDYSKTNRYYPKALLEAQGINADDFMDHMPEFCAYINIYASRLAGSLAIPKNMPYMARHSWMCESYWTDSNTWKAQTYLYTPAAFLVFGLSTGTNPVSQLSVKQFYNRNMSLYTFEALKQFGEELLNPILANEDVNIMSGDILKAYGVDGVVTLPAINNLVMNIPQYSMEVLMQMENAHVIDAMTEGTIDQETAIGTGYIVNNTTNTTRFKLSTQPTSVDSSALGQIRNNTSRGTILNFHSQSVTPEMVMIASRCSLKEHWGNTTVSVDNDQLIVTRPIVTAGSEIINFADMYYYQSPNVGVWQLVSEPVSWTKFIEIPADIGTTTSNMFMGMTAISMFDWHPQMGVVAVLVKDGVVWAFETESLIQDLDNYAYAGGEELTNLHEAALMKELFVPYPKG